MDQERTVNQTASGLSTALDLLSEHTTVCLQTSLPVFRFGFNNFCNHRSQFLCTYTPIGFVSMERPGRCDVMFHLPWGQDVPGRLRSGQQSVRHTHRSGAASRKWWPLPFGLPSLLYSSCCLEGRCHGSRATIDYTIAVKLLDLNSMCRFSCFCITDAYFLASYQGFCVR